MTGVGAGEGGRGHDSGGEQAREGAHSTRLPRSDFGVERASPGSRAACCNSRVVPEGESLPPAPADRRIARALWRHLRRRHELYWAPLAYAAAFVFLYRPIFTPELGAVGFGWDTIETYWPDLAHFARRLGELDWPLWNPFEKGGTPYHAVPERGEYYPLNWLLAGYGAVVGDVSWWTMQVKQFAHHLIAALTMHAFLRSRGLPRPAALVGGMAWLGSAALMIHKASSVIWPLVWTPLLWIAIDRVLARPTWRRGAVLGGAIALAGHAGSPPGFFYALLLAVPYGAWRVGALLLGLRRDRPALAAAARRLAVALGVGAAVTLGLLWLDLAASAQLTALSQRAERSVAYALSFPLPATETLIGLVAPLAGKWDSYVGVAVLLLGACALASRPRADGGVALLFLLVAAVATVLSFGGATPILAWLVEHVPGFDFFRASNRYKLLAAPALAALAGYGVAALLEAPRAWSRPRVGALAAGLAVVALVAWAGARFEPVHQHPALPGPRAALVVAIAAAILAAAAALAPARLAAACALLLVPLVLSDPQRYVHARNPALEPRMDHREDLAWLAGLADVREDWRIYDEFVLEQRAGSRLGVREFRGYPAGGSLEYQRYADVLRLARGRPEILEAFNIRYVFHGGHHRAGKRPNHLRRPPHETTPEHFRRLRPHVHEALHPAPLVAWYGAARFAGGDGRSAITQVLAVEDPDGVRRRVVLEDDARASLGPERADALANADLAPPEPTTGRVVDQGANRVVTAIEAPAAGVVVLNEAFYPGWKVRVDGEPAEPFFANAFVRGVWVDAGTHVIEWRFRPSGHGVRLLAFWVAVLVLILAVVPPRRYRGET